MQPGTQEWFDQVAEDIIDPDVPIVDPHHHLWPEGGALPYGIDELVADTGSGHHIVSTVFIECFSSYRMDAPVEWRSLGETEFVAQAAADLRCEHPSAAPIAGIVAHVDLALGDRLGEVLDAHVVAGDGLVRGVRDALASPLEPDALAIPGRAAPGRFADDAFRDGVRELGRRGLTYDTWHYHHQIREMLELARAVPETVMVLDHFGTPLGVGRFVGRHDEIFEQWTADIAELATCQNVVAKLGGLAMPDNGFGWHTAERPPTSDEFVSAQERWYHHAIQSFGPERCMFESNFPVDRFSISYAVLWNALKKIAARYDAAERDAMFQGTARRVYRL